MTQSGIPLPEAIYPFFTTIRDKFRPDHGGMRAAQHACASRSRPSKPCQNGALFASMRQDAEAASVRLHEKNLNALMCRLRDATAAVGLAV